MKLSPESLVEILTKANYKPIYQEETKQVYFETLIAGKKVPIFFGIIGDGYLLQIISYLPFEVKEERYPDLARLLHRLNKEIDLPGYGMDEGHKVIFYRSVIYCDNRVLNVRLFDIYLKSTLFASAALIDSLSRQADKR